MKLYYSAGSCSTSWGISLEESKDEYRNLKAYLGRLLERPAVQKVYKEEGLI